MIQLTNNQLEKLCETYDRGWIIHYWEEVCDDFKLEALESKIEIFFYLIGCLLHKGKIKFGEPDGRYWNATPKNMLEHLKQGFPKDAVSEYDPKITSYFYDDWDRCPPISWLDKDGGWCGS